MRFTIRHTTTFRSVRFNQRQGRARIDFPYYHPHVWLTNLIDIYPYMIKFCARSTLCMLTFGGKNNSLNLFSIDYLIIHVDR